jgi:hypothetical protein
MDEQYLKLLKGEISSAEFVKGLRAEALKVLESLKRER